MKLTIVLFLLAQIPPDARDGRGFTPLMSAAFAANSKSVDLLLSSGADPNAQNADGDTPLHLAAASAGPIRNPNISNQLPRRIVQALIAHHAQVNARRKDGRTPLMAAAMMAWPGVVEALLAAGADLQARDAEQRLAIDYVSSKHPEILNALRKASSPEPTGHSGRLVCDAQAKLNALGYDAGPVDCVPSQQFWDALGAFTHIMDIMVTNRLDPAVLAALGLT